MMYSLVIFGATVSLFAIGWAQDSCYDVNCPFGTQCVNGMCLANPPALQTGVCNPNPCRRNCQCKPSCQHEDGYYCESPDGYLGKNCDIRVPELICANNAITLNISRMVLDELYPMGSRSNDACFHVSPLPLQPSAFSSRECEFCIGTRQNSVITLPLPFTACGTSHSSTSGYLTYNNSIWANLKETDYDMPKHLLHFSCAYDREYNVLTSLRPMVEISRAEISDSLKLRASIELCKISSACPGPCPNLYSVRQGAAYTVSETIHATINVETTDLIGKYVVLRRMHISCTERYNDRRIALVRDGCVTSLLNTRVSSTRGSNAVCVSFKVPRMTRCGNPYFFIHAELSVSDALPVCSNFDVGELARKRRSPNSIQAALSDANSTAAVVFAGPIYVIRGRNGLSRTSLFTDVDFLPKPLGAPSLPRGVPEHVHEDSSILTIATAVVGSIAILLFIASFFCLYFRK